MNQDTLFVLCTNDLAHLTCQFKDGHRGLCRDLNGTYEWRRARMPAPPRDLVRKRAAMAEVK